MAGTPSSNLATGRLILLGVGSGVCVVRVLRERRVAPRGRVHALVASTQLVHIAGPLPRLLLRVVGQLGLATWRGWRVVFDAADLPVEWGAAARGSIGHSPAVLGRHVRWAGGVARRRLALLGQLLTRLLELLLQDQDGALHALHLLVQLDDEVVQLWGEK